MVIRRQSSVESSVRTFLGLALLTIGFLAALGTVLGFFGSIWWAFDVLANFRFQYALILVVTGVLYLLLIARGAAVVFLAAAAVNIAFIVPLWIDSHPPPAGEDRLNIVSFNVHTDGANQSRVIEWLKTLEADYVFLQETSSEWIPPIVNADLPYVILSAPPPTESFGTTVLARVDSAVNDERADESFVAVQAPLGGRTVTILSVHPPAPSNKEDAATRDELLRQTGEIAQRIQNERGMPVVVVGDLNATRWSSAFHDLADIGALTDSAEGYGFQATWPAVDWPLGGWVIGIPIDHALCSQGLTVTKRDVGPNLGGDHLPLRVELALASGN